MFCESDSVTPDCTRTSTVPVPAGTTAVTCESSTTVTFVAAVLPKRTWRWPAAPEKFAPVTVIVEPAEPEEALRPVTTGVRFDHLEIAVGQALQPVGRVLNVVVVPGQREVVVRVDRVARPAGEEVAAVVGDDHAVVLHGLGDDLRLRV